MSIRLTTIAAAAFCAVLPLSAMAQSTAPADTSGAAAPTTHKHTTKHSHHSTHKTTQPASDSSTTAK